MSIETDQGTDRDARLRAIAERVGAATPGPWKYDGSGVETIPDVDPERFDAMGDLVARIQLLDADGTFIAGTREDVPWLLAEVERLSALLVEKDRLSVP